MRDFYNTYENQPELMCKAQALDWTQNVIILDCCETDEQRAFYIAIATKKNLSKSALMKAIEADAFETTTAETVQDAIAAVCPTVGDCTAEQGIDTIHTTRQPCGAFVTACEPPRQGSNATACEVQHRSGFCSDTLGNLPEPVHLKKQPKRIPCQAPQKAVKPLPFGIGILFRACRRWRLFADQPARRRRRRGGDIVLKQRSAD